MDEVELIKQKLNIVTIVGEYVTLKKMGRNYKGLCPFHGEKTPSFMVNEELQIYKCFGCGVGGDVFKFVMDQEGIDFRTALERLAERAGVELKQEVRDKGQDEKKLIYEINSLASEFYHFLLMEHAVGEPGREYLKSREINEKLAKTYKLGFAPNEWESLSKYLIEKKGIRGEAIEKAGLAISGKNGFYDRFRGRMMFPITDITGRVVAFSGRILPEYATGEEGKYINSPETMIYHKGRTVYGLSVAKKAIKEKGRVVVVEGNLDAVSSYGAGVSETIAITGTALTMEVIEMIRRFTDKVVLALDSDTAGQAATKKSIDGLNLAGMSIKVVPINGGKDPDEIARASAAKWREMVESAVPVYEYFFDLALARHGTATVEAMTNVIKEVLPEIAKIENVVIKEVWIKKLAEKLGIEKERVWEEINKIKTGKVENKEERVVQVDKAKVFLWVAVRDLSVEARSKLRPVWKEWGESDDVVWKLMRAMVESDGTWVEVSKRVEGEVRKLMEELEVSSNEEKYEDWEAMRVIREWLRRAIKEERQHISDLMREAELVEDQPRIDKLAIKLVKYATVERLIAQI